MATTVRSISIDSVAIGGGAPLVLIAGPCVIESDTHARRMAEALRRLTEDLQLPFIFKSSYDKANRSSLKAFRGPGLTEGLAVLQRIREELAIPVLSDIHTPEQAAPAAEVLDVLQIPAFLCRQTDLIVAAASTGKPVNIKKGQFMAPLDMRPVLAKAESTGNQQILLTERGASFGYNNLVSDMRALPMLRQLGAPVVFDATHSVQLPGGLGDASGGDREMAQVLARSAVAAGVDGLFLEVHDDPEVALCDGPNMIPLDRLRGLLEQVLAIDRVIRPQL